MAIQLPHVDSLRSTFERFFATLDATTVPDAGGGRRLGGWPHAIALSEASSALHTELRDALEVLCREYGHSAPTPPQIRIEESDSPDGPWTAVPESEVRWTAIPVGGNDADALLVAALHSAFRVVAFPTGKWNELQARRPGGPHQRWHVGEIVSSENLAILEAAGKMLKLMTNTQPSPPTAVTREISVEVPSHDLAIVTRGEQRWEVRGSSLVKLLRFVYPYMGETHSWSEIQKAWTAMDGMPSSDRSTWKTAGAGYVPTGEDWKPPPPVESLMRYGSRIREALGELGVYWHQDGEGVRWAPPAS